MTKGFDKERARSMFHKMLSTDKLHRSVLERFVDSFGIHRSQHMTLMYISRNADCPSQKSIAEHFGISPAAVVVTLRKLEESGFIKRECSESDSRFNHIHLTEKGTKVVEDSKFLFEETDYMMFAEFSEEDYVAFEKCLQKMTNGLKSYSEKLDEVIKNI